MTTIDIDEPALEPVTLQLDRRVTLGGHGSDGPDRYDRVSLGRPYCQVLDPVGLDPELTGFLRDRPTSVFMLLAMVCSFRAVPQEPLEQAWLEVRLRCDSPAGAVTPTAWSMEPLVLQDPVTVSHQVTLDASLKLTSPVVPIVSAGPAVGRAVKAEFTRNQPWIEAYREGTDRPSWIFSRTPVTEVRGVHRLRTVIEMSRGAVGHAEIVVGATVRLKLLGLVSYRTDLADVPSAQVLRLPPANLDDSR